MKTELINLLLKAEIVRNNEVERALHYESGSSLVERLLSLGYGNEGDVFSIIQNKLKLVVVKSETLKNIPKNVIDIIPREIVEKHHILPFYMDDTTVHVAMFDPTQDRCLSEMCFFTNLKVVPYGALASDITKALNKYYGLSLPEILRYGKEAIDPTYKGPQIPVLKPEPVVVSTSKLPPLPKMPVKPVIPTVPFVEKMTLPPLPPLHGKAIKREDIKESVSSVQTASKSVLEEIKRPVEKQKPTNVVNEKIKRMQDNFDKLSDMVSAEEEPSLMVDYDDEAPEFNDVSAGAYVQQIRYIAIEQGRNKDAVLNATMAEIKKISSRSVIMFIKYDDIVPIVGAGNGIIDNINNLKLSLSESSIFSTVYSTKREYYGPMPKGLVSDRFLDHFGHHMPESIAIVPSMIDDEVFCLIYAEDTDETLELKKIADSMSNAFNRLLGNV